MFTPNAACNLYAEDYRWTRPRISLTKWIVVSNNQTPTDYSTRSVHSSAAMLILLAKTQRTKELSREISCCRHSNCRPGVSLVSLKRQQNIACSCCLMLLHEITNDRRHLDHDRRCFAARSEMKDIALTFSASKKKQSTLQPPVRVPRSDLSPRSG